MNRINNKGFSLAEVLIAMMLISMLMVISMPAITKMTAGSGLDSEVRNCLITENGNSLSESCKVTLDSCKFNRKNSCNTLRYFSEKSTDPAVQVSARTLLRDICNEGGQKACDLIFERCITDNTFCHNSSLDLDYYLSLPSNSTNTGASYILAKGKELFFGGNGLTNIVNKIQSVCDDCNTDNNLACMIKCSIPSGGGNSTSGNAQDSISQCNQGNTTACDIAYNNSWNRSCEQIKNAWPAAVGINNTADDIYKIRPTGISNAYNTFCDMTNGGWTLAMSMIGSSSTFKYSSGYWSNTTPLNPDSATPKNVEYKGNVYNDLAFSQIKIVMDNSWVIDKPAPSLLSVFINASTTSYTKDDFKNLINSSIITTSVKDGYNTAEKQGFNQVFVDTFSAAKVRFGYVLGNTNDSCLLGLGLTSNFDPWLASPNKSAGSYCDCDNNNLSGCGGILSSKYPSWAYVYIK